MAQYGGDRKVCISPPTERWGKLIWKVVVFDVLVSTLSLNYELLYHLHHDPGCERGVSSLGSKEKRAVGSTHNIKAPPREDLSDTFRDTRLLSYT